ncbi:helix-turn-helix domain-containing protein [Nonomuraea sp. NPDC049141]|uniref:helix-turn-helix domain-containing protein n=1 Tax=Nonomuraea sp. NPDC049141 TaxID=3155500 RepID=UPI00340EA520
MSDHVEGSFDHFLQERLQDAQVRAAFEDARARSLILRSLVAERKRLKITQKTIADRMQTTQSAISDLENERADPRLSTLQRFARSVGASLTLVFATEPSQVDDFQLLVEPTQKLASEPRAQTPKRFMRPRDRCTTTRTSISVEPPQR